MRTGTRLLLVTAGTATLVAGLAAALASRRGGAGSVPGARVPIAARPIPTADLETMFADQELPVFAPGGLRIVFARRVTDYPFGFRATILLFDSAGTLQEAALPDMEGMMFLEAARLPDQRRLYAIADNAVESPGWTLEVFGSEDGGVTWSNLASVEKPHYFGTFEAFTMSDAGEGTLSLRLDGGAPARRTLAQRVLAAIGGDPQYEEMPAGLWVYRTRDGGRTWSSPELVRDDSDKATGPFMETLPAAFGRGLPQ